MLQRDPLIFRFVSKLFCEFLPAAVASTVGAFLLSQLAAPAVKAPAPVAVNATMSDDMVIQVVRAEQALTDARKAEAPAAEPAKAAKATPPSRPRVAMHKPKTVEPKTVEQKTIEIAALIPLPANTGRANPGAPLVLAQAAMAPAPAEIRREEKGMLRSAWDTVVAVPGRIRATAESLMDETPPRPPMPLPEPIMLKASM